MGELDVARDSDCASYYGLFDQIITITLESKKIGMI